MQTFVIYLTEGLRQLKLQILAIGYNMEMMKGATFEVNKGPFISIICFSYSSASLYFLDICPEQDFPTLGCHRM